MSTIFLEHCPLVFKTAYELLKRCWLFYLKLVIHLSPKLWPNQCIALAPLFCECVVCVLDISHLLIDFTQALCLLN